MQVRGTVVRSFSRVTVAVMVEGSGGAASASFWAVVLMFWALMSVPTVKMRSRAIMP